MQAGGHGAPGHPSRPGGAPPLPVVVVAEHQLLREAVRAALANSGLSATSLGLPVTAGQIQDARRQLARTRSAAGVLLCDVRGVANLHKVAVVINGLDLDWVVLTDAPTGLIRDALLDAGATAVLEANTRLEELANTLNAVAADRPTPTRDLRVQAARARLSSEQRRVLRRLQALSPREMEILVELYNGDPVPLIAARSGVSASTVRRQVSSLLQKVGASSQLQAVATYGRANRWLSG